MGKLSKEQRAALEAQLAEDDAIEEDFEVEIGQGDNFARVPYSKGRSWLQKTFGIDLDEEPKQEPEGKPEKPPKDAPADPEGVRRFGRRVS